MSMNQFLQIMHLRVFFPCWYLTRQLWEKCITFFYSVDFFFDFIVHVVVVLENIEHPPPHPALSTPSPLAILTDSPSIVYLSLFHWPVRLVSFSLSQCLTTCIAAIYLSTNLSLHITNVYSSYFICIWKSRSYTSWYIEIGIS